MRLLNLVLVTTGTTLLALSIIACSSAPPAPAADDGTDKSTGAATNNSTATNGSAPATPGAAPAATPAAAGSCAAQADADSCETCCDASTAEIKQTAAQYDAVNAKWKACACAPAVCATVCATDYCAATADPGDDAIEGSACAKCLEDNTDACDTATDAEYAALAASSGGKAEDACYQTCSALAGFDASDLNSSDD